MAEPQVPLLTETDSAATDNLTRDAHEHCLFPMTSKEQLDQEGLRIYTHEGLALAS